MHRGIHWAFFFAAVAAVTSSAAVPRSVWDGVYTKEQARRGQTIYGQECSKCHSENLGGGEAGPTLVGAEFLSHWNGKTAGALYENTRKTMPSDDPASLTTRQYADLVAYLLSANEFPAGDKELERDVAVLNEIRIEPKR
jgi:mono/diheme cytochrome c family protein